ncbi:aspartyl/asparaginyl beta-hydroxylase isoform X2 [Sitophilus oryzae]|uniref:Aspartyl/asparaginyl beta-hydroxylase isoform X2 n=1 Tax=Sitophilus oryzae TaxID=7048 RepID=A0A6J2YHE1_SITOR|nr:aspartyl/asparaginyl beta-hydroxylase isoform X2 [Sitophilus oryzae]
MSGEVRKRKDKKKRKDEDLSLGASNEDLNIHVYKEGSTGGNICAKIVFVLLFSALIVLIGLIVKENQGLNELEHVPVESRFSQIFEGWVEKNSGEHDEDHQDSHQLSHEHDDDDEDDHNESEEHPAEVSEEEQSQEYEDESVPQSEERTEETEEEPQSEVEEDDDNTVEEENESEEKSNSVEEEEDESKNAPDESTEDNDQADAEEEEVNEETAAADEEPDSSTEKIEVEQEEVPVIEKVEDVKPKESSGHPLEIKPSQDNEPTPNISRRNTIIPPPTLQEVEADLPDLEYEEEAYSEQEDDYSDEDSHSEHRSAREEYEDLRETYTSSMTPEGEFDAKLKKFENDVLKDEEDLLEEEDLEEDINNEEIESEEDYDDEDEELLKRLEAKYGKLGRDVNVGDESESEGEYEHSDITNVRDYEIKSDLDAAQEHLKKNVAYANKLFEALLQKYPNSPRSLFGKAQALDIMAEQQQRNDLLQQALHYYSRALKVSDIPDQLFVIAAERYIDRARFLGQYSKAVNVHWKLIERFPDNATYLNNLAVTYLTVNSVDEARTVLKRVLGKWPNDGFALVHYGFILKTTDNLLQESIDYMSRGLKTKAQGVVDGRFYFHLGDALSRLNKPDEAMKVYEEGVKEKVFMSKYQRSLYNVPRLTAKPWWSLEDLPSYKNLFSMLKDNWKKIREEGLSALNSQGYFEDEAENLKDTGTWKQFELFARSRKHKKNCEKSPVTCGIIQSFPDASNCKRGQTKFSVMHPNTHVWPHCGPTNCRLRIHLGLKVPPNTFIRVAEQIRSWKEGDVIIFDDSFEHEVWHNGTDLRLVLIIDVWHPELTSSEKNRLSYI